MIEDNPKDDRRCPRMYERQRLQKMIHPILMMKMKDDVPKLPMTYRDSPIRCTLVAWWLLLMKNTFLVKREC